MVATAYKRKASSELEGLGQRTKPSTGARSWPALKTLHFSYLKNATTKKLSDANSVSGDILI